jgi:hypothetical protein
MVRGAIYAFTLKFPAHLPTLTIGAAPAIPFLCIYPLCAAGERARMRAAGQLAKTAEIVKRATVCSHCVPDAAPRLRVWRGHVWGLYKIWERDCAACARMARFRGVSWRGACQSLSGACQSSATLDGSRPVLLAFHSACPRGIPTMCVSALGTSQTWRADCINLKAV